MSYQESVVSSKSSERRFSKSSQSEDRQIMIQFVGNILKCIQLYGTTPSKAHRKP